MNRETTQTIYVIDDDPEIRNALQWLFESVALNVKLYDNAINFLAEYNAAMHGCLIIDVRMPVMTGLELIDKLRALNNTMPIIVITGHGDIPMAVRAMKSGAAEFILKPINDQNLLETIYKHLNQAPPIIKTISQTKPSLLTKREQEVMDLIAQGNHNKEIAHHLKISISTVEAHRSRIMDKFQVKNLAQLIKTYYNIA